ncbi:MAG TPA: nickel pincer cofactor biosynthesis protein LarC [Actinomycetes bacterium]|nr:nickel pincer cofactor biosynthesis protein LarC [Actinomycetes bacterium]
MSIAWFQCTAGASGDMMLGALLDAGVQLEPIQAAVDAIGVEPTLVVTEQVTRHGLAATKVEVKAPRTTVIRTWGNVRGLLEAADLAEPIKDRAFDVFARLARAEGQVHRTAPEQVHFHEVGGLDAIADVVGTCAGLHELGVTDAVATPVAVGYGMTRGDHGMLPVPAPAVLALLAEVDAPTYAGDLPYEMCTPTGAALLAATVGEWGGMPPMRITAVGAGAGSRELSELPNLLRLVVGEPVELTAGQPAEVPRDQALLLETNVDDLDPRLWPPVLARLLEAGASDAWLTPIVMKKGRPAHTLSVLVAPEKAEQVRTVIFRETSTIGLRESSVDKRALVREMRTVDIGGEEIRIKIALLDGVVVNAQPEYEDVAAAAAKLNRPVKAVLAAAAAAAHEAGLTP